MERGASRPDPALRCPHGRILGSWYECLNTALGVDSPETPILVNSTPFSVTFSFEGLEESRILSYELQLKGVDNRATLDGGDTGSGCLIEYSSMRSRQHLPCVSRPRVVGS